MTTPPAENTATGGLRHEAIHDPRAPLLEVDNATVRYNGRAALEGVSFKLEQAEQVAVLGPNGAGKSTLFKCVAGLIRPASGKIRVAGQRPGRHICIAYLPQRSEVDWTFPVTVFDVVLMGRTGRVGLFRRFKRRDRAIARACLDTVGLADLAGRSIEALSGGQQQRMFIARALAQEAELMLMDEPFSGLDRPAEEALYRVLDELRRRKVTLLVATHDLEAAAHRFDRVLLLNRRVYGWGKPEAVLVPEHLKKAYGEHLQMVRTEDGVLMMADTCCGGGNTPPTERTHGTTP